MSTPQVASLLREASTSSSPVDSLVHKFASTFDENQLEAIFKNSNIVALINIFLIRFEAQAQTKVINLYNLLINTTKANTTHSIVIHNILILIFKLYPASYMRQIPYIIVCGITPQFSDFLKIEKTDNLTLNKDNFKRSVSTITNPPQELQQELQLFYEKHGGTDQLAFNMLNKYLADTEEAQNALKEKISLIRQEFLAKIVTKEQEITDLITNKDEMSKEIKQDHEEIDKLKIELEEHKQKLNDVSTELEKEIRNKKAIASENLSLKQKLDDMLKLEQEVYSLRQLKDINIQLHKDVENLKEVIKIKESNEGELASLQQYIQENQKKDEEIHKLIKEKELLTADLNAQAQSLQSKNNTISNLEAQIARLEGLLEDANKGKTKAESEVERIARELSESEQRINQVELESGALRSKLNAPQQVIQVIPDNGPLIQQIEELTVKLSDAQRNTDDKAAEIDSLRETLRKQREEIDTLKSAPKIDRNAEAVRLSAELQLQKKQMESAAAEAAQREAEVTRELEETKEQLYAAVEDSRKRIGEIEAAREVEVSNLKAQIAELQSRTTTEEQRGGEIAVVKKQLEETQKALARARAEADVNSRAAEELKKLQNSMPEDLRSQIATFEEEKRRFEKAKKVWEEERSLNDEQRNDVKDRLAALNIGRAQLAVRERELKEEKELFRREQSLWRSQAYPPARVPPMLSLAYLPPVAIEAEFVMPHKNIFGMEEEEEEEQGPPPIKQYPYPFDGKSESDGEDADLPLPPREEPARNNNGWSILKGIGRLVRSSLE